MKQETKSEIRARIDEIQKLAEAMTKEPLFDDPNIGAVKAFSVYADLKIKNLEEILNSADEDLFQSVIQSHEVLCAAKEMDEKAAYGQDPAMYYTLAICGEAGEMGNKIVKALRNGNDPDAVKEAVKSELPDVFIYGAVLAYVLEIDLTRLVNEKVQVVMDRARSGYYGGPLKKSVPPMPDPPKPRLIKEGDYEPRPKLPLSLVGPAPAPRIEWEPEFPESKIKNDLFWTLVGGAVITTIYIIVQLCR